MKELEAHLRRGELDFAIAIARTITLERERPLELAVTVRFLPLVAESRPRQFDLWALRWLERWCAQQRPVATIDDAAEIAGALAEMPVDADSALHRITAAGGLPAPS